MSKQQVMVNRARATPKQEKEKDEDRVGPSPSSPLSQALASTANIAKLLPTGTLVAFQILTPLFTNNGKCDDATRPLTIILLMILSVSCFVASFTDSVAASDGRVYYGLATFRGLFLFETVSASLPDLAPFRIALIDCIHAILSVLVFMVVALRDRNVVTCLYPHPDQAVQEVLDIVPVGVGILCSFLFLVFPTTRHGIGYPVSVNPTK